ncbi:MAG: DNRLRE domain-containing protein, partial [Thermoanaerobaculia bacterium]|nr:DNRLRE domain-containing protein [Thermoanaerobaculia bacterium]
MFKLGSIGIFLAALLAAAPVAGENRTVTFPAAADATLQNGSSANRNFGAASPLTLRGGSWPIVQFDLATLPGLLGPEGAVTSAELSLYVESAFGFPDEQIGLVAGPGRDAAPPAGFAEIYIGRLGAPWTEAGVTWNCPVDSLPANTAADCAAQWAGGQQIGADAAVLSIANGERGRRGVDLAADVRRFAAGMPNHGWRLRLFDPVLVPGTATFTSREGFAANRPQLVVAYDTDATPPAVTFTAPAGRFVLADPRPLLALSFSDLGSGVDAASFRLQVDGVDRSTWCAVTALGASCRPPIDLTEGVHTVTATLRDHDGETTTVTRIVDVLLGPGPFTRDWPATADATIRADLPTSPEGTSATVRVQANSEMRGLLRFALDELAELDGVTIDNAELRLSVASREVLGAAGLAVGVHRLTTDWNETEASWSCPRDLDPNDGLPCSGAGWTAGGAFEPTADASFVVADATPAAIAADVTAGVRAALPRPHGWLLRFLAAPASGRPIVRFGSREGAAGAAPMLRVTFRMPVLDPTPPTIAISAPSGLLVNQPRPVVSLAYADASGDLDPATLALEVDGADRTALCTLTAATASCPVGPLGPGTHTLVARISDRAGHVATATGSLELVLDELPPSIAFRAPAGGSLSAPSPPVLELSWSDADSAVATATFRFALD